MSTKCKKLVSIVLTAAMVLSMLVFSQGTARAEESSDMFTLYYYHEGGGTLYMNIWNHAGLEFGEGVKTDKTFGWDYPQAELQKVEGRENWYSVPMKIIDAANADEGFDIYDDAEGKNSIAKYSYQWDGKTDYAVMVSKESAQYAIKDGMLYRSLEEADKGNGEDENIEAVKDAEIQVERVPGLKDDFMMGMDISSAIVEFDSGVTYKDFEGKTIDNLDDFVAFLAKQGITHLRIRVWNDPKTADGKWYGGGNNDVAKAKLFADAARKAGIKMMVDFHVSDFWTDPGKQRAPKAWKDYTTEQKAEATEAFIKEALETIDSAKDTVTMVQVGNETNSGIAGETDGKKMCQIFSAGAKAVRAYNKDAKVVIHVTNPEKGTMVSWAGTLDENKVDYDMLATSYYPTIHGTLDNLMNQLKTVRETYKKDVFVAETSYSYTMTDSDSGGTIDPGSDLAEPVSEQGQVNSVRNIVNAVNKVGGLGLFYWEPAWITVGDMTGLKVGTAEFNAQLEKNKKIWEEKGSGWASSFAGEYGEDERLYYGGSAQDDKAVFYPDGTPTPALKMWSYFKTGAECKYTSVDIIGKAEQTIENGGEYQLPEKIQISYNKGKVDEPVQWNEADRAKVDAGKPGVYVVNGEVELSKEINSGEYNGCKTVPTTYTLTVKYPNLLSNGGFEEGGEGWTLDGSAAKFNTEDPVSGTGALHYWDENAFAFTVKRTVKLEAGVYAFGAAMHGRVKQDGEVYRFSVKTADREYSDEAIPADWNKFQYIDLKDIKLDKAQDVELVIYTKGNAGAWGSWDDVYIYKTGDVTAQETRTTDNTTDKTQTSTKTEDKTQTSTQTVTKKAQKIKGAKTLKLKARANSGKVQKKKLSWKAEGKLSYKIVGKNKAKLKIKSGKLVIPKKTKKGTYKLLVKITAKATAEYKKATVTRKLVVVVK